MKKNRKQLYIVPGWREKISKKSYQNLVAYAMQQGYSVLPIRYTSKKGFMLSNNIVEVKKQIVGDSSMSTILGFSTGALIVYKIAEEVRFKKVIICSISPVLGKDIMLYPESDRNEAFSKQEIVELRKMKYGKMISPAVLVFGENEDKMVISRSKKLLMKNNANVITVKNGKHALDAAYLKVIKQLL